jgi:hypothetical protein
MKRICLALLCGLLGILVTATGIPSQVKVQAEIPGEKLVNTLRLLNTQEHSYHHETGRFAPREELLTFLRKKGLSTSHSSEYPKRQGNVSQSPIDLENPKPYELAITASPNGMHYQITLKRPFDINDQSTWCKTAAFSDDAGVIFLGSVIDCEVSSR